MVISLLYPLFLMQYPLFLMRYPLLYPLLLMLHPPNREQTFRTLTLDGEAMYADRLYTVAMQKYHYNNLKPFLNITLEEVEKNGKIRVLFTSARDVVEEYLMVNQHLSRQVEGRLVVED